MALAALETYDLGDTAKAAELFVEELGARHRPGAADARALRYYNLGGANMAQAGETMRAIIEVRRAWSEAALGRPVPRPRTSPS